MQLIRQSGTAFVVFSLGTGLSYALQIVLARLVSQSVYGQYAYSMAVVSLLAIFASIGYNNSIVRFIPEYISTNKYADLRGFLNTSLKFTILGGLIFSLICFNFLRHVPDALNSYSAAIFSLILPLNALQEYYSEISRSLGNTLLSIVPNSIIKPIGIILLTLLFHLSLGIPSIPILGLSVIGASVISLASLRWQLSKKLQVFHHYKAVFSIKKWTQVSAAMILMVGFQSLLNQSDLVIIGAQINSTEAGLYSVSAKIASLASIALIAINQIFAPKITYMHASENKQQLQLELSKVAILTFFTTITISLVLYISTSLILQLFGPKFLNAKDVVHILLIGQVFNALTGPVGYILNLTGNHNVSLKIFGISALFNVLGCYFAARVFGTLEAVAWVTTVSMTLWNIWMHVSIVKRLSLWPSVLSVFIKL